MKYQSIKNLVLVALMSALLCILGPMSIIIPMSPVPISLGTLGIYLVVIVLGKKYGTISVLIYILLGLVGLPVFTGFTGGLAKLLGPTGGYIIGYIFLSIIMGFAIDILVNNKYRYMIAIILGTLVLYAFGTTWLKIEMNITYGEAIFMGVLPFVAGDIVKMIIAMIVGEKIKAALAKIK